MVAKKKHSVKIQVIFMFIPILSIYAYYRIQKLVNGILLSFGLSALAYGIIFGGFFASELVSSNSDLEGLMIFSTMGVGIAIFYWLKIHYMIKWTREWNDKIE